MDDSKRAARDMEDDVKDAWRGADGESLADKAANAGDRLRHGIENAGDEVHKDVDDAARHVSYEKGRIDEINREGDPGAR